CGRAAEPEGASRTARRWLWAVGAGVRTAAGAALRRARPVAITATCGAGLRISADKHAADERLPAAGGGAADCGSASCRRASDDHSSGEGSAVRCSVLAGAGSEIGRAAGPFCGGSAGADGAREFGLPAGGSVGTAIFSAAIAKVV